MLPANRQEQFLSGSITAKTKPLNIPIMTRTPKRALLLFACALSIGTFATAQKKNEKKDSSKSAAPTVQLIYTAVPKHLTATSTETLYSKDILKAPVTSVKSTLTGRMAGLYTY